MILAGDSTAATVLTPMSARASLYFLRMNNEMHKHKSVIEWLDCSMTEKGLEGYTGPQVKYESIV